MDKNNDIFQSKVGYINKSFPFVRFQKNKWINSLSYVRGRLSPLKFLSVEATTAINKEDKNLFFFRNKTVFPIEITKIFEDKNTKNLIDKNIVLKGSNKLKDQNLLKVILNNDGNQIYPDKKIFKFDYKLKITSSISRTGQVISRSKIENILEENQIKKISCF